jgi:hypothetical protein
MMEVIRDNRNLLQRIWCKLFHSDERFIDTKGKMEYHAVCIGHRCFNGNILIKKCWVENEFKEKIG